MSGFLFEQIVFGPVKSRRLGISLGINLLPLNKKHCTFNCLYCECGWTQPAEDCITFPTREEVKAALQQKLGEMKRKGSLLDTITFAGNGEPTIHPSFSGIIEDTLELRNDYFPDCKISVLSNATRAAEPKIKDALHKIDQNILKLDAGSQQTFEQLNHPRIQITLEDILHNLSSFRGEMIIQSLFVKGEYNGTKVDNTAEEEIKLWLSHIQDLQPRLVMIYPIARATPAEGLEKVDFDTLNTIAQRVEQLGIKTEVFY